MMLAEALAHRADTAKRIEALRGRTLASIRHVAGELPPEEPLEMLTEVDALAEQLEDWIRRINRTNATAAFDETLTLTDALARRDALRLRHSVWSRVAERAADDRLDFPVLGDMRSVPTMPVPALRTVADELAREIRRLDLRIQQVNWRVELAE